MHDGSTRPSHASRAGLELNLVLDTAMNIADRDGLDTLSIRKLAAELNVAPMTIYGYVDSKEDLFDKMASRTVDKFEVPPITSADWREHVGAIMLALRDLMLAHPSLVRLLTTRRVVSLGVTRSIEATLVHLRNAGFSRHESVQAYTALYAYTLGYVHFHIPRSGESSGRLANDDEEVASRLLDFARTRNFPIVAELAGELSQVARGRAFEFGLDCLIGGLRAHPNAAAPAHDHELEEEAAT